MATPSPEQLAALIDRLDHPDAIFQRELMDNLVSLGPEIIPNLAANLSMAEPNVKTCLVRILAEIGDARAILPLMRFVFDNRGSIEDADARGLAMQGIMKLARPEHASKLFDFLWDMRQDADPFVRGYALEAMARFGDRRAEPILRGALSDEHEFVRQRAKLGLEHLEQNTGTEQLAQNETSDAAILQKIRGSDGADRAYWLGILTERPNAFELASALVREEGKGQLIGLQLLQQLQDPRARQIATRHYRATRDAANQAICLRLLAQYMRADASHSELEIIRDGHAHSDPFVRMAALAAGGASGDGALVDQTARALESRDFHTALNAAEALSNGTTPEMRRLIPRLRDALDRAFKKRWSARDEESALLEAHLLRALGNVVDDRLVGRRDIELDALRSLDGARDHWPVLSSALRLLRQTSEDRRPLASDERWPRAATRQLADLLGHENLKVRDRALALLLYGAPADVTEIPLAVERPARLDMDFALRAVPLLEQTGGERSKEVLDMLANAPDEQVRLAAAAAARRLRNSQDVIDATFVKPSGWD